ncbi:DNA methyltransferase [Deinococcus radiodurans]|uniref:DNA methyltransferase n=1 Tax=Deinococcus radiodurans TaxID=1299 RepID=UPI002017CED1|nr:DNA methyltransferase [Deinococcus radiodurans]
MRALSEISVNGSLRPVNYAGLDSEELGSIYESLLELVPRIEPGPRFSLTVLPGNERKSTGSYYTPGSLIDLLLDSALDPVIEDAVRDKLPEDAIAALKGLKVIDPACGSGHFLIAAARRIGARLAELEEETSLPSPRALRKATRTVIAHCIYGADINPMAIELAKVALWLESQDAGRPLAFLDHRLRVGNSLLGATPELMNAEDEIPEKTVRGVTSRAVRAHTLHLPDEAFSAI